MAFSGAAIKYKPVRVGFLVRDGSIEDIVKSAGINSVLWGGIYNPIIPIKTTGDNELAKQMIDLFSVDILYAVTEVDEIKSFKNKFPFLRCPGHYAERIFYEDWPSKKMVSGLLDSKNIVNLFWSRGFDNKPRTFKSNFLLSKWDKGDPLSNVLSLQFGFFPEMNFKFNYENAFLKGLHAQELNISPGEKLMMDAKKSWGPIDVTGCELKGYNTGARHNGNGLYIGDSNNFEDLVNFWNIRASGVRISYLAKDYLERGRDFAQGFLDQLNSLPNRHPEIEDRLVFYYTDNNPELIEQVGKQFKSKKVINWYQVSEFAWNGANIQPPYWVFKWQKTTTHIEKNGNRYTVNIKLPPMNFLADEDDIDINHQQLGVIIDPYGGDHFYPDHTLKLPRISALNEFYSREVCFDPWALRIDPEGFSKIIRTDEESLSLYPVLNQTLVEKIFDAVGVKAEKSQPGLIAKKIIEKIGEIEDARVLKIKGVRMILEGGNPETAITRGHAIDVIFKNDFEKHKRLFIEARDKSELTAVAVFDYLLKKNYFRAGLELICEHCKLANWLSLKEIDDQWLCDYCGGKNQTSVQLNNRGDWKYRKSGLFSKNNHQEGAIPVLLTLLALYRVLDRSNFTYTTALKLHGSGINCETDLFVMQEIRRDALEIGIGECKSEGGEINNEDCEKMKSVAKKLTELRKDVYVYIIFAKTSDSFSSQEIELFQELSKDFRLILLTNKELEPYEPYWTESSETQDDIPETYPNSLADFSRNSHARYLKSKTVPDKPTTLIVAAPPQSLS